MDYLGGWAAIIYVGIRVPVCISIRYGKRDYSNMWRQKACELSFRFIEIMI